MVSRLRVGLLVLVSVAAVQVSAELRLSRQDADRFQTKLSRMV